MKKEFGIWMSTNKAVIVSLCNGKSETVNVLESGIEKRTREPGNRKAPLKLSSLVTDSSSKMTNRKKHQMHQFISRIIGQFDADSSAFYLIGPSTAKIELEKELKKHQQYSRKPIVVEPADILTLKQIVAQIKLFFEKNNIAHVKTTH